MFKRHIVNLCIQNNTQYDLTLSGHNLEYGHLAHGHWPKQIDARGELNVQCDEGYVSPAGCSGWVAYKNNKLSQLPLYFCFSNPVMDDNQIDVGMIKGVRKHMEPRPLPIQRVFSKDAEKGEYITVNISSTEGTTNNALWVINVVNTQKIAHENTKVADVPALYNSIQGKKGSRVYYDASAQSKTIYSHFKGVGAFRGKLIFTHTNVAPPLGHGIYLIGNKCTPGSTGAVIEANYHIQHVDYDGKKQETWGHPGGVQVCGSYMAVAFQKSDDSKHHSEIRIFNVNPTLINETMELKNIILRSQKIDKVEKAGINGAGMTKEIDKHGGRYIVACTRGCTLDIYRSNTSGNIEKDTTFTKLKLSDKQTGLMRHGGSGLGLITQENGELYCIGMHASDGAGASTLNLYQIHIDRDKNEVNYEKVEGTNEKTMKIPGMTAPVKELEVACGVSFALNPNLPTSAYCLILEGEKGNLNSSFRWGKGMAITSPNSVEIYATDRNILPSSFGKNFSVVTWKSNLEERRSVQYGVQQVEENANVKQHYDSQSATLKTTWNALPGQNYEVVVNDQNGSVGQKSVTGTSKGETSCIFNIDELQQCDVGGNLVSAMRIGKSGTDLKKAEREMPYLKATPPCYRLGQAKIITLYSADNKLTGTWDIPYPGDSSPLVSGYYYQILDPDDNDKVVAQSYENDGSGNISIETGDLGLTPGASYELQIRANGTGEVVPGEWSAGKGFVLMNFPGLSSNAPSGFNNGYFLIGDAEADIGDKVIFWGSNWVARNTLKEGSISSSYSDFCGYMFVNHIVPEGLSQGAYNGEINSGVSINQDEIYSMPVISSFETGTDKNLPDHYKAIQGTVTKIVNVYVTGFQDDYSDEDAGEGTIHSIVWEASS